MKGHRWRNGLRWWRTWLWGDAIRTSPVDRVWLSLEPPCILLWQGERIDVLDRREFVTERGLSVRFECITPRGRETLIVHPGELHKPPEYEWTKSLN